MDTTIVRVAITIPISLAPSILLGPLWRELDTRLSCRLRVRGAPMRSDAVATTHGRFEWQECMFPIMIRKMSPESVLEDLG